MTYRPNIKRLDNCSPERVESISKSLSKLQKLRGMQHTSVEAKQHKKFANPKSNFADRVYQGSGPGKKIESSLNNLIKRSLMPLDVKMKNVLTPTNMKPSHKVYLETKAIFNAVKHHGITSYTKKL